MKTKTVKYTCNPRRYRAVVLREAVALPAGGPVHSGARGQGQALGAARLGGSRQRDDHHERRRAQGAAAAVRDARGPQGVHRDSGALLQQMPVQTEGPFGGGNHPRRPRRPGLVTHVSGFLHPRQTPQSRAGQPGVQHRAAWADPSSPRNWRWPRSAPPCSPKSGRGGSRRQDRTDGLATVSGQGSVTGEFALLPLNRAGHRARRRACIEQCHPECRCGRWMRFMSPPRSCTAANRMCSSDRARLRRLRASSAIRLSPDARSLPSTELNFCPCPTKPIPSDSATGPTAAHRRRLLRRREDRQDQRRRGDQERRSSTTRCPSSSRARCRTCATG